MINYIFKKFHLIMAFLFGIVVGLMQYGLDLNWFETGFSLFGFSIICNIHYNIISKEFIELEKINGTENTT